MTITTDRLMARLSAKRTKLVNEIAAARRALDTMEHELAYNPANPMLTGSRGTFASLLVYASEVETLSETITEIDRA